MHKRYAKNEIIKETWATERKLALWQKMDLAVIDARASAGEIKTEDAAEIRRILEATPIDIAWWEAKDKELNHDLIAFVEERKRHLPDHLKRFFHERLTSYDTEESPFISTLTDSTAEVGRLANGFMDTLAQQVKRYRFSVMLGETHGQWAELQTYGKRIATWLKEVWVAKQHLFNSCACLRYSKLSGAIGNSPDLSPEIQAKALDTFDDMEPFAGATQIMPRALYAPLARSLANLVATLQNIAVSIRLNARSARPLVREPFKKTQRGSSRMPQKQNPIITEQMEGMKRMAEGYAFMIEQNIVTWNERAIEQSSVERVAWPDLFFVVSHALERMNHVVANLRVYPDIMLEEIRDSRGTYAASKAADFLAEQLAAQGHPPGIAYRMIQLAAFNLFEPHATIKSLRENPPDSYVKTEEVYREITSRSLKTGNESYSLRTFIPNGWLVESSELAVTMEVIQEWNALLRTLFRDPSVLQGWNNLFGFEYNLRAETDLIDTILEEVKR